MNLYSFFIVFTQANWFRAAQYCRFHGMHLASISSQEENDKLEKHIRDFGKLKSHTQISTTHKILWFVK